MTLWRLAGRVALIPASAIIGSLVMFSALHFLPGDPVARDSHQTPLPYAQRLQRLRPDPPPPGLPFVGYIARRTRTGLRDVMRSDYVTTARAKGLTEERVVRVHALRNALIVVVSVLGPVVTSLITGSLVIEQFTAVPGLGHEL